MTPTPTPSSEKPAPENHQTTVGSGASACSLLSLVAEWENLAAAKWSEIRASKGHRIFIYLPQVGHARDMELRRETSLEVMRWTEQWFSERGHAVKCVLQSDGESFGICKANNQMEARDT